MNSYNDRASRQALSFCSKDKVAWAGLVEGRRCIDRFKEGNACLKVVSALIPLKINFLIDAFI